MKTIFDTWKENNIKFDYCERYDVYYNIETGEFLEKVNEPALEGGEMFTENWINDGRPTIVPTEHQEHLC
jgi:hypothetical protein